MKEVYVLKHTHVESNPHHAGSEVKPTTLHILNLTYQLAVNIGLRQKVTSLFSDGHDEEWIAKTEDYLAEVRRYERGVTGFLKMGMKQMLQQGHLGEFQSMWSMLMYATLQDSGIAISLKPTDIAFRKFRSEIGPQLFYEWCLQTDTDPCTVTPEQFEREILPLETRFRDDYIHQQMRKLATERNLLVIGAAHQLESLLADQDFMVYGVGVEHKEEKTYEMSGTLPENLSGIMDKICEGEHDLSPFLGLGYSPLIETRVEFVG